MSLRYYVFVLVIFCMTVCNETKPLTSSLTKSGNDRVLNYLIKYGYLSEKKNRTNRFLNKNNTKQTNVTKETSYTNEEIQIALKDFQDFMSIPKTGKVDLDTITVMNRPRCGVKDRISRSTKNLNFSIFLTPKGRRKKRNALNHFSKNRFGKSVTYEWQIDYTNRPSRTDLRVLGADLIEFGLNRWAAVSGVKFQNRNNWIYADIIIYFYRGDHGDGQPFDGKGGELAHASASEKKIHFDDDENWLYYQIHSADFRHTGKMPDFVQTVVHEMGHVLGLSHSKSNKSVMFPTIYSGPAGSHFALDQEDINRVQALHGSCWPDRIDAVFSNFRGDGKTYLFVGPYIYLFDDLKVQVEPSYPRASYHFFGTGFNLFDDIFHNTDGLLYFMWNGWYYYDYGQISAYKYRVGKSPKTGKVGWPGLQEDTIDAGLMHLDGKLYLFRKDLVYRWDPKAASPVLPHFPKGYVEKGWPKKISEAFPGLPNDIDSAFRWYIDGAVYFFKGKYFYIWDETKKRAKGVYATHQWKNICDMITCGTTPCRSWALNKNNCNFCSSNQ